LPYAQAQRQVSLSVLTPVFNERHLVLASLARVLTLESELISRLELIVVDDCSDRRIVNCNVNYFARAEAPH
jgi:glycosyltransferase involved in cell wall biosynthesis